MTPPDFFFAIDPHLDLTVVDFLDVVLAHQPRKEVGTVQIRELCGPTTPHGVYVLFSSDGVLQYVGKTTSRSFIERIPAHFDSREFAWFNTLAKRMYEAHPEHDYQAALRAALSFEIVLIGVVDKQLAMSLEMQLRTHLKPTLNPRKPQLYDKPPTTVLRALAACRPS